MTIEQERDIAVRALERISDMSQCEYSHNVAAQAVGDIKREQVLQALSDEGQVRDAAMQDAMMYGTGVIHEGKHVPYADLFAQASPVTQDDDPAETAYWRFDARKKGYAEWKGIPQTERDAFKAEFRASVAVPAAPVVKESLTTDDITHEFTLDTIANGLHYGETKQLEAWKSELSEYIRVEINRAMLASQPAAQPVGEAVAIRRWDLLHGQMMELSEGDFVLYSDVAAVAAPPVEQDQSSANDITEKFKDEYDRVSALRAQDKAKQPSTGLQIAIAARDLLRAAEACGQVLTIHLEPRLPLAMGNYVMTYEVRPARVMA